MKIGIDMMGGDFAPEATVKGVILAQEETGPEAELILYGDEKQIVKGLKQEKAKPSRYTIVDCPDQIFMGEHPSKAFAKKPGSSIATGFQELKKKTIDGFCSAGNTGAMLVASMYTVKSVPGIIRPSIAATIPKPDGSSTIILDVGINPDARPDVLYQYGILGSLYARHIFQIEKPRVGLLNIGAEEEKGNLLTKNTFDLMKDTGEFNFIGNIEGNDLFSDEKADVVVCDGFVGNIILKQAEGFYATFKKRNIQDAYLERFNFENYGGTPILGINSNVVIGHGVSNANAIKAMIKHTRHVVEAKLSDKIKEAFN